MSRKYIGGIITKNPAAPTTSSAKGIWTLDDVTSFVQQGFWPRSPGAPIIGTVTISGTTASVPFTVPVDLGTGSITYRATSSPDGFTATGTSPISVSGLTDNTYYTFTVTGTTPGGTGPSSTASNSVLALVVGQQLYTGSGTYTWVAPAGVNKVSVVAIGGQTSGNNCPGGGLGWKNNITVIPGNSYTVGVGQSYFIAQCIVSGLVGSSGIGGLYTGDGGGNGGDRSTCNSAASGGGGGAGGYSGNGGKGGTFPGNANITAGSGGAGGGGMASTNNMAYQGQGGGGVGVFGQGASGAAGGCNGGSGGTKGNGGNVGGSSGGGVYGGGTGGGGGSQTGGAVRIIWPGNTRLFPSTGTADQ